MANNIVAAEDLKMTIVFLWYTPYYSVTGTLQWRVSEQSVTVPGTLPTVIKHFPQGLVILLGLVLAMAEHNSNNNNNNMLLAFVV